MSDLIHACEECGSDDEILESTTLWKYTVEGWEKITVSIWLCQGCEHGDTYQRCDCDALISSKDYDYDDLPDDYEGDPIICPECAENEFLECENCGKKHEREKIHAGLCKDCQREENK